MNDTIKKNIDKNLFDGYVFEKKILAFRRFFSTSEGAMFARKIMVDKLFKMCEAADCAEGDYVTVTETINNHKVELYYVRREHDGSIFGQPITSHFKVDGYGYSEGISAAATIIGGWDYSEGNEE